MGRTGNEVEEFRTIGEKLVEVTNLDEIVDQAWLLLTSDQYLVKFWQLVKDLKIDHNELREGNIGTDFETREKFLIIDISIFGSWT